MDQRSPVHEIVHVLWSALTELRVDPEVASPAFVEHAAFSIHGALSAPGREYHNHDHVIEIAHSDDPLEVIAALYHDAVYIQVDRGVPHSMASELARVFDEVDAGWRILPAADGDVLAIFARRVGDGVTP